EKALPYLTGEKKFGVREYEVRDGISEQELISLQMVKIYSPLDEEKVIHVISNGEIDQSVKNITPADIIASINYFINLLHNVGSTDDIDHLGNRRLRSVGELLQNQFRIGLSRMERVVRERMSIQDANAITPQALINIRPVT